MGTKSVMKSPGAEPASGEDEIATRVMIVDDHALVRLGLAQLIDKQAGLKVVAQSEGMADTLKQLSSVRPDLMTIDLSLRDGAGLELIKQVASIDESIKILVISMHDERIFAERVLKAGAKGYLNKEEGYELVIEAVRTVESGQIYLSPSMTTRIVSRTWGSKSDVMLTPLEALSDRELEVFELLGRGLSTRSTATTLHVSIKTVETHRERIKSKLALKNGSELIQAAIRWNFEQGSMGSEGPDGEAGDEGEDEDEGDDTPIGSRVRPRTPRASGGNARKPPRRSSSDGSSEQKKRRRQRP